MIRWGIIGCGEVTEVKSGPGFSKSANSELVAVMRRDAVRAEDYARRHGVGRWSANADDLIGADDIDAIYIATPPATHAEYAIAAMKAGKHVFVEKPMALTVTECDQLLTVADETQCKLTVAFYRRSLPRFEKLRSLIQSGAIGEPRTILSHMHRRAGDNDLGAWRLDPAVGGGGLFVDMQSHVLDWLQYVFGRPEKVTGLASNQSGEYRAEDTVSASLQYDQGVMATFDCCFESDRDEQMVTISGTSGRMSMPFLMHGPVVVETSNGVDTIDIQDPEHVHMPMIERIVEHLHGRRDNPCPGDAGRDNIVTIRNILDEAVEPV